jgi:DNA-binding CsgD family transcriptional regulator
LIRNTPSGRSQTFITATLSDKEKSILTLMCEEKTTQEIAGIMEISPRTVESIREKLKEKTGAKSMVGLALYAVASDIVESKELV